MCCSDRTYFYACCLYWCFALIIFIWVLTCSKIRTLRLFLKFCTHCFKTSSVNMTVYCCGSALQTISKKRCIACPKICNLVSFGVIVQISNSVLDVITFHIKQGQNVEKFVKYHNYCQHLIKRCIELNWDTLYF